MIKFDKFSLDNGLKIIVHPDPTTPLVTVNLLYNVGARDEDPERTGFAHLFEHLMFGGSVNIPEFDTPLQSAGGVNNAFTNNDFTNYYISLPKENLETAFWLESDRMLSLAFTDKSLDVQRQVVIEEFRQRYLNQPYGDVWLLLRPLAYKVHPYQWATIGKDVSHIEKAEMQHVKDFFFAHYAPDNCIMVVAGNTDTETVRTLAEKWFGPIEARNVKPRNLPQEPAQTEARVLRVQRDVPTHAYHRAYHACARTDADFHATDLLSDILSMGESCRLYQSLVKEQELFTDIDAYLTGSLENNLFVFSGKLSDDVDFETAEAALLAEIEEITKAAPTDDEIQKVKNIWESKFLFNETNTLNKAMSLAYFELIGQAEDYNTELEKYLAVTPEQILAAARKIFRPENSSTLFYEAKLSS